MTYFARAEIDRLIDTSGLTVRIGSIGSQVPVDQANFEASEAPADIVCTTSVVSSEVIRVSITNNSGAAYTPTYLAAVSSATGKLVSVYRYTQVINPGGTVTQDIKFFRAPEIQSRNYNFEYVRDVAGFGVALRCAAANFAGSLETASDADLLSSINSNIATASLSIRESTNQISLTKSLLIDPVQLNAGASTSFNTILVTDNDSSFIVGAYSVPATPISPVAPVRLRIGNIRLNYR